MSLEMEKDPYAVLTQIMLLGAASVCKFALNKYKMFSIGFKSLIHSLVLK